MACSRCLPNRRSPSASLSKELEGLKLQDDGVGSGGESAKGATGIGGGGGATAAELRATVQSPQVIFCFDPSLRLYLNSLPFVGWRSRVRGHPSR